MKSNLTVIRPGTKTESPLSKTAGDRSDIKSCELRMLYERMDNQESKLEEIIDLIRST